MEVSDASPQSPRIVIASTFTADPVVEVLNFWADYFGTQLAIDLCPMGQVPQLLLSATSQLSINRIGANVVCLRVSDFASAEERHESLSYCAAANRFVELLSQAKSAVPLLVVLCPDESGSQDERQAKELITEACENTPGIHFLDAAESFETYHVERIFDPDADKLALIPYTDQAFASIGSMIFRYWNMLDRPVAKVIASDCDNTLWRGIIGEDGSAGIKVDEQHKALHQLLNEQNAAGRLICLLSKNEEADVRQAFRANLVIALPWERVTAHRINWSEKADNLSEILAELKLGREGVIFLDDNAVEIGKMRARYPEICSIQLPEQIEKPTDYFRHLWPLDLPKVTREDQRRARMYAEDIQRSEAQSTATSLRGFFDELNLQVSVDDACMEDISRASQLSHRTNQFNASLLRLSEGEVRESILNENVRFQLIRVQDKFGDYGVVGALRGHVSGEELVCDLFMLSCRALGRGVEHQMVRVLGEMAIAGECSKISIIFNKGPRNAPVRQFLASGFDEEPGKQASGRYSSPTHTVAALQFDVEQQFGDDYGAGQPSASSAGMSQQSHGVPFGIYEKIASELRTADQIFSEMTKHWSERPRLSTEYQAPSGALQTKITELWQNMLRVKGIGARDSFHELGGKSLQLVQIHGQLERYLGRKVEFTSLFEYSTVVSLAEYLEKGANKLDPRNSNDRAEKMRMMRQRRRQGRNGPPAGRA